MQAGETDRGRDDAEGGYFMLAKYNLKMPHSVFSGEDALENICGILEENQVKHLAVFTDQGIRGAGLLEAPMARWRRAVWIP